MVTFGDNFFRGSENHFVTKKKLQNLILEQTLESPFGMKILSTVKLKWIKYKTEMLFYCYGNEFSIKAKNKH